MAAAARPMAKVEVKLIHCVWRDGRPRFEPGPALRALGFKGEDLRHPDGRWLALQEASEWLDTRLKEIEARRLAKAAGKPARTARGPRAYAIEDLFEDLWRSQRFRDDGLKDGKAAPKTIRDYKSKAKAFGAFDPEFYMAPAARVTAPIVHGLHEKLWKAKGLHMANGMIAVLRLAYSHAIKRGKLTFNPCLQLGLPTPDARLRVATPAETEALLKAADDPLFDDAPIGDAILIALYTGQREADVLELEQRNEKDGKIRFIQNKTGARVVVPALPHLAARLEAIKERRAKSAITVPPPSRRSSSTRAPWRPSKRTISATASPPCASAPSSSARASPISNSWTCAIRP